MNLPGEAEFQAALLRDGKAFSAMLQAIARGEIPNPYEPEYDRTEAERIRNERLYKLAKGVKNAV